MTLLAADMVTVQLPVPVQSPLQPAKLLPASMMALNVTEAPLVKLAEQIEPQLIPEGELVTVPAPVPDLPTVRMGVTVLRLKVAVTLLAADMVTVQLPVPVQSPLQPAKLLPASVIAVNVTEAPLVKLAEQVEPQLIPEGELVTVPLPVPDLPTVRA
ncbi:conserved hypothetical protein [Gammaproteobacteria bacterium]